jgi:hypothetical protein
MLVRIVSSNQRLIDASVCPVTAPLGDCARRMAISSLELHPRGGHCNCGTPISDAAAPSRLSRVQKRQ